MTTVKEDAQDLIGHIEGHIGFLKDALADGRPNGAEKQAAEIFGWAEELRDLLVVPKK
jgi:hypothetical protein